MLTKLWKSEKIRLTSVFRSLFKFCFSHSQTICMLWMCVCVISMHLAIENSNGNLLFSYISSLLGSIWFTNKPISIDVRFSIFQFYSLTLTLSTYNYKHIDLGTSIAFMRNKFYLLAIRHGIPNGTATDSLRKQCSMSVCIALGYVRLKGEDYSASTLQYGSAVFLLRVSIKCCVQYTHRLSFLITIWNESIITPYGSIL